MLLFEYSSATMLAFARPLKASCLFDVWDQRSQCSRLCHLGFMGSCRGSSRLASKPTTQYPSLPRSSETFNPKLLSIFRQRCCGFVEHWILLPASQLSKALWSLWWRPWVARIPMLWITLQQSLHVSADFFQTPGPQPRRFLKLRTVTFFGSEEPQTLSFGAVLLSTGLFPLNDARSLQGRS